MTTIIKRITLVEVVMFGLLGLAAQADLISIDFNHMSNPDTASGTVTDVNGHDSLPGQVGAWNDLLVGNKLGSGYQVDITDQYTSGTLFDGNGKNMSGVSLVINPNNIKHFAFVDGASPRSLQRDMLGVQSGGDPIDWQLSGLETSMVYRLRMFGREYVPDSVKAVSEGAFTATGATSDSGFSVTNRNFTDLSVKSTAEGIISGTLETIDDAAAWSGIQIEWDVATVISIDFGFAGDSPPSPGPTASGTVVDYNDVFSLPGQAGKWNELLMGDGTTPSGPYNYSATIPRIAGLTDGGGNPTVVSFSFNTEANTYTTYITGISDPYATALHRDVVYVTPESSPADPVAYWQIDGLDASTEYTLKLFGYQNSSGSALYADFSATGMNTATGGTSALQNYVDLVVTSSVGGQITGVLANQAGQAGSTWSGIQIQGPRPFPLASDLISIDFETADTGSKTPTASGAITDRNGDTSWGQAGVWNSLISGSTDGGNWHSTTLQPIASNLFDGEGNATTVDFQFNTGTIPATYYVFSGSDEMLGDMFTLLNITPEVSWQLTGLQPDAYYTMRMFGQPGVNFSTWEVSGMYTYTDSGTNTVEKNYVDLTVPANAAGVITGKLKWFGPTAGSSWSGMQILKLTDEPWAPTGNFHIVR